MAKKTVDEIIKEIAETLVEADGYFIQEIANQVLMDKVVYKEDGFFEQEE